MGIFIGILWIAFYAYWLGSAFAAKKNARVSRAGGLFRLFVVVTVILLFIWSDRFRQFAQSSPFASPAFMVFGTVLTVFGLMLAVWARVYLGKNWGMPMTLKEAPELVTSGPYRFVRHPIYGGILLAMLGSAFADSGGALWLLVFILFGSYFIFSAKKEEQLMVQQFPDRYPEYMKRTKMIVPWVL